MVEVNGLTAVCLRNIRFELTILTVIIVGSLLFLAEVGVLSETVRTSSSLLGQSVLGFHLSQSGQHAFAVGCAVAFGCRFAKPSASPTKMMSLRRRSSFQALSSHGTSALLPRI